MSILFFVASVAFVAAGAFWSGWEWRDSKADAEIAEMESAIHKANSEASEKARAKERELQELSDRFSFSLTELQNERRRKSTVITREVVKYAKSHDAGRCSLPPGWVRTHNQAAAGRVPENTEAASGSDDAADGLTDIDALKAVTENYQLCVNEMDKLKALQQWAKSIAGD